MEVKPKADSGGKEIEAGVFLIDKPIGPASFTMVQKIRRILKIKKVGHAGTLDPFASGLLIICVGRPATRIIPLLMGGDKVYEGVLKLGLETDTQDSEGKIIAERPVKDIGIDLIEKCFAGFVGEYLQTPPQFSALKHKGKPLYYYARKGVPVEKEPRPVQIKELNVLSWEKETIRFRVKCSKGTYIRTLATDIGKNLGPGACLINLRRLQSGPFSIEKALNGEILSDKERAHQALIENMFSVEDIINEVENYEKN